MDKYIVRRRKNRSNKVTVADCNHTIGAWERVYLIETISDPKTAFLKPIETKTVCFICYRDKYKEHSQYAKEIE